MTDNILVLDLETKSIFSDHEDRRPESLGVSVVGTYCYRDDKYYCYREEEMADLEHRLSEKPLIVGFNIRRFDMPVLKPYLHFDPCALPMLDMLEVIHETLGRRISLENVAQATIGSGKSGSGLDAVEYYRKGEFDKLIKYCMDDVKVTKAVAEYGAENGELFYLSKFEKKKARIPVEWALRHEELDDAGASQMGLF